MVGGCTMVRRAVLDAHDQGGQDKESQGAQRDTKGHEVGVPAAPYLLRGRGPNDAFAFP
jgi:hypothetical protein